MLSVILTSQEQGREAQPGKSHLQQLISPGTGSFLGQPGQGSPRCHCYSPCQCHYPGLGGPRTPGAQPELAGRAATSPLLLEA